jgi:hypothetical protein
MYQKTIADRGRLWSHKRRRAISRTKESGRSLLVACDPVKNMVHWLHSTRKLSGDVVAARDQAAKHSGSVEAFEARLQALSRS